MGKAARGGQSSGVSPPSSNGSMPSMSVFKRTAPSERITLGELDPQLVIEALDAALNDGVLVGLSRTSDGGAIGVFVTDNGQRDKAFAGTELELEELFTQLRLAYS